MDDTLHNSDAGRQGTGADPSHDQAASRDSSGGTAGSATAAAEFVTICAWCPQLHILSMQRRDVDVVIVYQLGKELRIIRNGKNLKITSGICAPCSERLHPRKP